MQKPPLNVDVDLRRPVWPLFAVDVSYRLGKIVFVKLEYTVQNTGIIFESEVKVYSAAQSDASDAHQ